MRHALLALAFGLALPPAAEAQEDARPAPAGATGDAELAKKLSNPVSDLISVPFQSNYDCCFGPDDGWRYTLNIQPVVPLGISQDWNLIVRTIVPVIYASKDAPREEDGFGFGDTLQSFFLSPKAATHGIVWGVGPAVLWPTGTNGFGGGSWGAGPTVVVLKQSGRVTYGLLANQVWTDDDSSLFLQPFYAYTYPNSTTITLNTQSTYDWEAEQWNAPVYAGVSHVYKLGRRPVQLQGMLKYYVDRPQGGPEWGAVFNVTLLYPK